MVRDAAACLLVALLLLCHPNVVEAHKILVYNSKFGHSHSNFLGRIADILAEAGHDVTTLIPIMDAKVADGTTKTKVIYVQPNEDVAKSYEKAMDIDFFGLNFYNPIAPIMVGPMFGELFGKTCKKVLEEPGLLERLKNEKYDVYITENFDICGVGISEAIKPKAVISSTSTCLFGFQFPEFGIERAISYRPSLLVSKLDNSIVSRFWNIYAELSDNFMFSFGRSAVNKALKAHFGPDYPSVAEQSANVAYVLTNSEPLIETAGPTLSKVIDIPGIGAKTPKALDEKWESVLNLRPKTVLLSFGSMAKSKALSEPHKMAILKAFSQFPDVTFIWKYEAPEDDFAKTHASKLKNLVLTNWMPQVDILNHKNLALFITHGGMGSTQETSLRGVPGLFIPLFGDQPRNAGMMEANELGVVYDKFDLHDGDKLAKAIRQVLENPKYGENARRVSAMLAKKPFSSIDLLIKHVEFAAEFGPSPALRPQSTGMNWIEYNNIDLLLVFIVLGLVMFCLTVTCIKKIVRRVFCTVKRKVD